MQGCYLPPVTFSSFLNLKREKRIKGYLHHILPPLSIIVVVSSIVKILVFLLQVDAALAAFLPDVAVCSAHVTEAKDGESDQNRNNEVVDDGPGLAGFLVCT